MSENKYEHLKPVTAGCTFIYKEENILHSIHIVAQTSGTEHQLISLRDADIESRYGANRMTDQRAKQDNEGRISEEKELETLFGYSVYKPSGWEKVSLELIFVNDDQVYTQHFSKHGSPIEETQENPE